VEFKRLAMRIHEPGVGDTLRKLVAESVNRDHSADDAELLCETFKEMDSVVVGEVIAVGLERLGMLLSKMVSDIGDGEREEVDTAVDMVLRIMCSVGVDAAVSDQASLLARHRLLDLLGAALQSVGNDMSDGQGDAVGHGTILRTVTKLLRFVLGLNIPDNAGITAPRPDFVQLVVALLRVLFVSH
jgi:mediator of RNA polymerase II transcription subunit 12